MPVEVPNQPDGVYRVRVRDLPLTERRYQGNDGGVWGGYNTIIGLKSPGELEWYNWLIVGEEFVKRLHRASGEYLARKAQEGRDAGH